MERLFEMVIINELFHDSLIGCTQEKNQTDPIKKNAVPGYRVSDCEHTQPVCGVFDAGGAVSAYGSWLDGRQPCS